MEMSKWKGFKVCESKRQRLNWTGRAEKSHILHESLRPFFRNHRIEAPNEATLKQNKRRRRKKKQLNLFEMNGWECHNWSVKGLFTRAHTVFNVFIAFPSKYKHTDHTQKSKISILQSVFLMLIPLAQFINAIKATKLYRFSRSKMDTVVLNISFC